MGGLHYAVFLVLTAFRRFARCSAPEIPTAFVCWP